MTFLEVVSIFLAFGFLFILVLNMRIKFDKKIKKFCLNRKFYNIKKEFSSSLTIETIITITLIWIFIILFIYINYKESLKPNELGDFLAGLFAPILFTWVVFGIFLQKKEFTNAIDEYKRSIKFLDKQSINTDIQHQNEWFNRNANLIEKNINYIESLIKNKLGLNSLNEFYKLISKNSLDDHKEFFLLIEEISIHNNYIKSALKERKTNNEDFNKALDNLLHEYRLLFENDTKLTDLIYCRYLIVIYYAKELYTINKEEFSEEKIIKNYKDFFENITEKKEEIIKNMISKIKIEMNIKFMDSDFVNNFMNKIEYNEINIIIKENQ